MGGSFTTYRGNSRASIARVNSDGSNDGGFDPGTGFNGTVWSIVPATDGSGDIIVGGDFSDYNGTARNNIARINSDGSLDTEFDPGLGFNFRVRSIAAATDGSGDLYVGGSFTTYKSGTANRIIRLDSNGNAN